MPSTMKLEVVTLPVSDVDRAKAFYEGLGWRLDADIVVGDAFRVVQLTPPQSACSISFGKGLTTSEPGSAKRLLLVVEDIFAACDDLKACGVDVSEVALARARATCAGVRQPWPWPALHSSCAGSNPQPNGALMSPSFSPSPASQRASAP